MATGDYGLALFVLAGCAHLYAATGESELAVEIGALVSGHFATWRETKVQIANLLAGVKDLSPQCLAAAQERGRRTDAWDVVDRLLQNSLG